LVRAHGGLLVGFVLHGAGRFTDEEHARTETLLNGPAFMFRGLILHGAWGRRPE
jgi:hypothetical protein